MEVIHATWERYDFEKARENMHSKSRFIKKSYRKVGDDKQSGVDRHQPNESNGKPQRRVRLRVRVRVSGD